MKRLSAILTIATALVAAPASAGPVVAYNINGSAATACNIAGVSSPTSKTWSMAIAINSGTRTPTIAGAASVNVSAACNDPNVKLKISAPTAACAQNGNGNPFSLNYTIVVKQGSANIASVVSPAVNTVIVTPPLQNTTYTISVNASLPAGQSTPNNGSCPSTTITLTQS